MSATTAATPQSAAAHTPAELTFLDACDLTGIVHYAAPSKHEAGRINVVGLDTTTGAIACDCKAAQCGRSCWHGAHVAAAWLASPAMLAVRWLTAAQLVRYGTKHALCVATYRTRIDRALADDMLALVAARCEFRRRAALTATRIQDECGPVTSTNTATTTISTIGSGVDRLIAQYAVAHLVPTLPGTIDTDTRAGAPLAA